MLIGLTVGVILVGALAYQRFFARKLQHDSVALSDIVAEHGLQYSMSAYEAGRTQAERDIQQGTLATESYGLPAPWSAEYESLLAERYHIQQRSSAGCVVSLTEIGHAKGYNEVMRREIETRFGEGLFQKVAAEAIQKYDAKSTP